MTIVNLFPGSYGSNCYLLEDSGEALSSDAGDEVDFFSVETAENNVCIADIYCKCHNDSSLSLRFYVFGFIILQAIRKSNQSFFELNPAICHKFINKFPAKKK